MNRKTAVFLLTVACLLALAGCSAIEFNRNLEDAIGSAARTKVQTLARRTNAVTLSGWTSPRPTPWCCPGASCGWARNIRK